MKKSHWRLIPLIEAPGKMQMAIDLWLLEQHRLGRHPPSLRFYTWSPPAISLGYHQREIPSSWQNLIWQETPIDLVTRPTGGRAVLHQGDLSYMVVTSFLPGKRLEVYKNICQFLLVGWHSLGVDLDYGKFGKEYIDNPNCFATATGADLLSLQGKKFIGSAQLRRAKAILQHGSMMLSTDAQLFHRVFGEELAVNPLPTSIDLETIVKTLAQAAINCFTIDLIEEPFSKVEWQDIFALSEMFGY